MHDDDGDIYDGDDDDDAIKYDVWLRFYDDSCSYAVFATSDQYFKGISTILRTFVFFFFSLVFFLQKPRYLSLNMFVGL